MAEEREITIKLTAKNLTHADFAKARAELAGIRGEADKAGASGAGMGQSFKGAAAGIAGFVGGAAVFGALKAGLGAVVGGAIEMNSTLERSTLQFGTLMGDSARAEAHVKSLFEFAKRTPFETGPIIQASRMLQTFGGSALNTEHTLTLLGDAAAATGAPIEDLGFWVGRMYANLKAGQPFGEAAARLQELAVLSPSARAEMEALQKAGKSGEEVFAAFQTRMGAFSGAMVAQAGTWEGLKSSIADAVNIMMADALRPLFDLVKTGAAMTLEVLGSRGMAGAFDGAKAAIAAAFGNDGSGGQSLVRGFLSAILTGADLALGAVRLMMQGFAGLQMIFMATASVVSSLGLAFLSLVSGAAQVATKIPGIGSQFVGLAGSVETSRLEMEAIQKSFSDQAAEALEGAKGNSAFAKSIDAGRSVIQAMKGELASVTIAHTEQTAATRAAVPAKAEYIAKTKEQIAAEKEAAAESRKLQSEIEKLNAKTMSLYAQINAGMWGTFSTEIAPLPTLLSRTTAETARQSAEAETWARTNNFVLVPAIRNVTAAMASAAASGPTFRASMTSAFQGLSGVMLSAIQGGGDVGKAAGAHLGGSLGKWAGEAAGPMLGSVLGKGLGGSVASMFGPVGTMIGGFLGEKIGAVASKAMGAIFKSEGKKVNNLRDDFVAAAGGIGELDAKAAAAGLTLDRLLRAKNVKDYKAAVDELNAAFGQVEADTALAREAMEEWGISASEAGQKFAQADMDKTSGAMLAKLKAATAAGVELNAIVSKGGDDFGRMVHQAIRSGTTISNEFRPVLAAMIESKTLVDENGEAFTDLSQIPFAEDIGSAIRDGIGTPIRELVDFFKSGVFGAFKAAGDVGVDFANRVAGGIARIPREITIEVNGTYNPPDIEGSGPGYAVGTFGRHGSWFVDFPKQGIDTRLHGREAVIREDQAPAFVADYLAAMSGNARPATGAASAPVVNTHVLVEIHGDKTTTSAISETEFRRREINRMGRGGLIALPVRAVVGV